MTPVQVDFSHLDSTTSLPSFFQGYEEPHHQHQTHVLLGKQAPGEHLRLDSLGSTRPWNYDLPMDTGIENDGFPMSLPEANLTIQTSTARNGLQPNTPGSHYGFCSSSESEVSISETFEGRRGSGTRRRAPSQRMRATRDEDQCTTEQDPARSDSEEAIAYLEHYRESSRYIFTVEEDAEFGHHRFVADYVISSAETCILRLAVLAWIGRQYPSESTAAIVSIASWYSRAEEAIEKFMLLPDSRIKITENHALNNAGDLLLCTSLYLNRYDLLSGDTDSLDARLRKITQWLERHPGDLHLSAFACRTLLWLCYLQIRTDILLIQVPHVYTLLDELRRRPDHQAMLEKSHHYHSELFRGAYPEEQLAKDIQRIPVTIRVHEMYCLLGAVIRYRTWRQLQAETGAAGFEEAAPSMESDIEADFRHMDLELGLSIIADPSASILDPVLVHHTGAGNAAAPLDSSTAPLYRQTQPEHTISRVSLDWLGVYGAFLAVKILWSRVLHPELRTEDASSAAVASILQIALQLRKLKDPQHNSQIRSSCLWPLPMLLAGVETTDDVHADWLRVIIEQVATRATGLPDGPRHHEEMVGGHVSQLAWEREADETAVMELLERTRERQDIQGRRVEIESVARELRDSRVMLMV